MLHFVNTVFAICILLFLHFHFTVHPEQNNPCSICQKTSEIFYIFTFDTI